MLPNLQETAGLVTFTEEILNGKLYFLCSGQERNYFQEEGPYCPKREPNVNLKSNAF